MTGTFTPIQNVILVKQSVQRVSMAIVLLAFFSAFCNLLSTLNILIFSSTVSVSIYLIYIFWRSYTFTCAIWFIYLCLIFTCNFGECFIFSHSNDSYVTRHEIEWCAIVYVIWFGVFFFLCKKACGQTEKNERKYASLRDYASESSKILHKKCHLSLRFVNQNQIVKNITDIISSSMHFEWAQILNIKSQYFSLGASYMHFHNVWWRKFTFFFQVYKKKLLFLFCCAIFSIFLVLCLSFAFLSHVCLVVVFFFFM